MNMMPVDTAISRFRRGLRLGAALRFTLLAAAFLCILGGPLLDMRGDEVIPLFIIGFVWMLLSYRSMIGTRIAADSPSLIAAGDFEQAETRIDKVLRSFSLFRTAKLLSIHHLALLRHAQKRWQDSARLCQALLSQRNVQALSRSTLLMMADSMLQLNDLRGAYRALTELCRFRLTLAEALALQLLQLDYGSRIAAWEPMLAGVAVKVQMAELMPSVNAARSQAFLALAAYQSGRIDLARWLRRRAELLADPPEIVADHPALQQMFNQTW
jgi:hypothetical protein